MKNCGFTPIIILILIALLAGGGYYVYKNFNLTPKVTTQNTSPVPTATLNSISNWKIYKGANFSFSYPSDWTTSTDTGLFNDPTKSFILDVEVSKTSLGVNGFMQSKCIVGGTNFCSDPVRGSITGSIQYNHPKSQYDSIDTLIEQSGQIFNISLASRNPNQSADAGLKSIYSQILSTFKFTEATSAVPGSICKSTNLSLSLTLPTQSWTCKVDNLGKEIVGYDGIIALTSPIFKVQISSLGRGAFCDLSDPNPQSPRYDPTNACQISAFYSKNTIDLKIYKLNGETKEIFGQIGNGPSISITFSGMETRDLTPTERSEITKLLDSIQIIK